LRFRLNWSDGRGLRRPCVAGVGLIALALALAVASPAQAAGPYVLEVREAIESTGFGEVACEYKVEGVLEVEQPCEALEFETKKQVKLKPAPEPGSEFVHFENGTGSASACNGLTGTCTFTIEADSYVEARFDAIAPSLAVHPAGEGEVSCMIEGWSQSCEAPEEYEFEAKVTVIPEPAEGWEFAGYRNGTGSAKPCVGLKPSEPCTFILKEDSTIEAVFEPIMYALKITKAGTGQGAVTCNGTTCSSYPDGAEVTLKATPASGSTFSGWSGEGCSGTGTCLVTIEAAPAAVTATFQAISEPIMYALKITKAGTGQGTVTCNGTTCASSYVDGAEVTLKATPASGSTFAGWSGEGCSGTGTCLVTIEAAPAAVTATFQASTPPPPPPPPTLEPEGTAKAGAIAKVKAGKAQVKLTCAGGPCNGTLKLTAKLLQGGKRKSLTIGRGSFSIAEGAATTLKVKLSASAVRELAKAHSLKARAGGSDVIAGPVKLKLAAGG
jgi:hypothetical protein